MDNLFASSDSSKRLPARDHQEYELILKSLLRKYVPVNGEETVLVESLAHDVWTSRRMIRLRIEYPFDLAGSAMLKMTANRLANAARNYTRALKLLNQLRKDRPAAGPPKAVSAAPKRRQPPSPRTTSGEWVN